jgi:hypothetical protein
MHGNLQVFGEDDHHWTFPLHLDELLVGNPIQISRQRLAEKAKYAANRYVEDDETILVIVS